MSELWFFVRGETPSERNKLAGELSVLLSQELPLGSIRRVREGTEAMDAGSIIVAILAAPTVVALAKEPAAALARGIADWLSKRRVTIDIGANGSIRVENVPPTDVVRVLKQITSGM